MDETQIICDYTVGHLNLHKLAKKYGCHYIKIKEILTKNNIIIIKPSQCKTIKHADEIIDLYERGSSTVDLGKKFHISTTNVRKFLKQNSIPRRKRTEYCRKYPIDIEMFKDPSNEICSYWLGFLMADGHLNKKTNRLACSLAWRDVEHLYNLARDLQTIIQPTKRFSKTTAGKPTPICRIHITNQELSQLLKSYGWRQFKRGKIVLPINLNMRSWLRGLIDGDGIVSHADKRKYLKIGICSPHRSVVKFVQTQLNDVVKDDVKRKINKRIRLNQQKTEFKKPFYEAYWVGSSALKIAEWLYTDQTRCLKRKLDKVMPFLVAKWNKTT